MTRPPRHVTTADGERLTELDVLTPEEIAADQARDDHRRTRRWQARGDVEDEQGVERGAS